MPVMSARFIPGTLPVASIPARLELVQELGAALLLVGLVDGGRRTAQAVEGAQEAAVGLVAPAHVAGASPARLAQAVEAAVVADAEARVPLDVVAGELAEACPPVEEAGPARDHRRHRGASLVVGLRQRRFERAERVGGFGLEHGLGNALRIEADGVLSGHGGDCTWGDAPAETGTIAGSVSDPEERLETAAPPPDAAHALEEEGADAREHPKPPPATKLVLVRHAVTEQTGPMLTGRAPGVDLSEDGRGQAKALGERLGEVPVAAVYASPIERTTQT